MAVQSTLKNIAEKTGLSVPTVSQILNNRKNFCSEATKARVREAAQELGYRPNFAYQLMQGKKTMTAAILLSKPQMNSEEYVMGLVRLLIAEFDQLGYAAYCSVFTDDPAQNLEKTKTLIGRGVAYFIFLGCPFGHETIVREIEKSQLQYIGNYDAFSRWVENGSEYGREAIFRYLLSQVGRNFKIIYGREVEKNHYRLSGLQRVFPERTVRQLLDEFFYFSPEIEFSVDNYRHVAIECGYETTARLLEKYPDINGIVYSNDCLAIGGCTWLLQPGHERFHHLRLAGCNNNHALDTLPLPVTSFEFDLKSQAELLVKHVLTSAPCQITVHGRVHVRALESSAKYPPWREEIIQLAPPNNHIKQGE